MYLNFRFFSSAMDSHLEEFCCVAFVENGSKKMGTVLSKWILNGILYWPKTNFHLLMKQRAPPKETWYQISDHSILYTGSYESCIAIDSSTETEGEVGDELQAGKVNDVSFSSEESDAESDLGGDYLNGTGGNVPLFPQKYASPKDGLSIKPDGTSNSKQTPGASNLISKLNSSNPDARHQQKSIQLSSPNSLNESSPVLPNYLGGTPKAVKRSASRTI